MLLVFLDGIARPFNSTDLAHRCIMLQLPDHAISMAIGSTLIALSRGGNYFAMLDDVYRISILFVSMYFDLHKLYSKIAGPLCKPAPK